MTLKPDIDVLWLSSNEVQLLGKVPMVGRAKSATVTKGGGTEVPGADAAAVVGAVA